MANCNFANLLVCHTNGYHLTAIHQIKAECFGKITSKSKMKLGLPANNQRLDHRTKFFYLDTT